MLGRGNFNVLKLSMKITKTFKTWGHLFLKIMKNACFSIVIYFCVFPVGKVSSWVYLAVTSNSEHFIKICQIKLLIIIFNQIWISSRHIFIIVCIHFIFFLRIIFLALYILPILNLFISEGAVFYTLFYNFVLCVAEFWQPNYHLQEWFSSKLALVEVCHSYAIK